MSLKVKFENIRFVPLIVALWFLLFSFPMIYYFKKKISYEDNFDSSPSFKKIIAIVINRNAGRVIQKANNLAELLVTLSLGI